MGPKLVPNRAMILGVQLGPMSITKLSPNWASQMGPIHCPKFLLPGLGLALKTWKALWRMYSPAARQEGVGLVPGRFDEGDLLRPCGMAPCRMFCLGCLP